MEDAREARRKRLAERKADRLAFITGQNRTLAQSAPQDVASGEDIAATETPKRYHSEDIVSNVLKSSNREESALKPDTIRLHKHEVESENPQEVVNYVLREQKNEVASNERSRTRRGENISGQLFTTSTLQNPAGHGSRATNGAPNMFFTIFTARDISRSVLATENIRLLFSFVVALLVISSYNGFMIGGRLVSSIISFRPIFLVLLTDLTIILGWALLSQEINQRHEKDAKKTMQEDDGWPNNLSRILEIGQVLHKIIGAAFMDCSICAVILICGIVV